MGAISQIQGNKFDENGINYNTRTKYDEFGYDKDGYDLYGFNKNRIHKNTGTEYNEKGYKSPGEECLGEEGYNYIFYDKDGYDRKGFDENGIHKDTGTKFNTYGYDKLGYNKEGYNKNGFNIAGIHKDTGTKFNIYGYDRKGFDRTGYNADGFNREGNERKVNSEVYGINLNHLEIEYDTNGYNKWGIDYNGYDKDGYDIYGYDKEGYNRNGFNQHGINKETKKKIDKDGYDFYGYDKEGYNRNGFNSDLINKDTGTEYDKEGYDIDGYNKQREQKGNNKKSNLEGIKMCSLASGSNGNCYYIGNNYESILIDDGISYKQLSSRMKEANLNINSIKGIFISHEHSDHVSGLPIFHKNHPTIPIYFNKNAFNAAQKSYTIGLEDDIKDLDTTSITLGGFKIHPFKKSHDTSFPISFRAEFQGINIGVFTDIGKVNMELKKQFSQCNAVFLESNYDEYMLKNGPYSSDLKKRVKESHLSNNEAYNLIKNHANPNLKIVVLSHISANNNNIDKINKKFSNLKNDYIISIASREEVGEVFEL